MYNRINAIVPYMIVVLLVSLASCGKQIPKIVNSPDNNISAKIILNQGIQYEVFFNKDNIIDTSVIDITLADNIQLHDFELLGTEEQKVNESWERVWGKKKDVVNNYNELVFHLREKSTDIFMDLYFRAYNDGIAFRYGFPEQESIKSFNIGKEETQFAFPDECKVWRADYQNYRSSQEQEFMNVSISDITADQLIGMPLLAEVNDSCYAVITEADLTDWAGAFLVSDSKQNTIVTNLAPHPEDTLIAVTRETPALSPWRVIMVAKTPGKLIESDLIANLNDPVAFDDCSWIRPGAAAWDWWWCNSYMPDAGFEPGPNQQTMKYFIDFASEMGWEYQIVDWQWYGEPFADGGANPNVDITTCIDGINIEELVDYAASKGVKIIVWLHWEHLQKQMDEALALYEKWGVSGIKVDFMDRQDQDMVNFYHEVARKAADHKLVVDFHGAYKPTGVSRTYPNLITREGVMGNEYNKWSNRVTPEHNVTLPFTRGLLGEMDYTPVSFNNVSPDEFVTEDKSDNGSPMVQTTRCQQMAMPVVYESAFTVFCDSPDNYLKGNGVEFLKNIPTTWDETKVLAAVVGDYVAIARRAGTTWYMGAMTDGTSRELSIDLSFLGEGQYNAVIFEDDPDDSPSKTVRKEFVATDNDSLTFVMAEGGGGVGVFEKIK